MKEKLTLQDLVDLLAKKTGMTKKEADAFFREFFAIITENIFNNEPVKIKDFGAFKLTNISSRESVDVNTGEKIEIPAHYKLSFLPDKSLKSLINKPFENFEITSLKDSVEFDSIETSEEPVESPDEDEDTGIDEIEPVNKEPILKQEKVIETITPQKEEEDTIEPIIKEDEVEKEEKVIDKKEIVEDTTTKQTSFVYTYKSDQKDHANNETITISISNEKTIREVRKTIDNVTPSVPSIIDINKFVDAEASEDEQESNIPLDINKVHEKINQLKEAIDSLSTLKSDSQSELTDSSDTLLPSAEITNAEKIDKEEETEVKTGNDIEYSIPVEDKIQHQEITTADNNDNQELKNDTSVDTIDEYDPYYNEDRDSVWYKIRNRLPVIIFSLITIALGAYLFTKLFEQKNTYDNYLIHNSPDEFESHNLNKTPKGNNLSASSTTDESAQNASVDSSFVDSQDFEISGNLKIKNLNKASETVKQKTNSTDENDSKFPLEEKITSGASLRIISKKHYGYNAFWVYIYQENRNTLTSFDNLVVGKTIIIPNLKKYGVDINNPQSIKIAKEIEQRLFAEER